jgi:hypothetical protein
VKYFGASELLEQVEDRPWLAKVTNALNQHWQKRNAAKKTVRRMVSKSQNPCESKSESGTWSGGTFNSLNLNLDQLVHILVISI